MATAVNYTTILDSNFKLSAGGDKKQSFQFQLPASAPRHASILGFRVLPDSGSNFFFVVAVNNSNVFQATLAAPGGINNFRTVHEIVEVKEPAILQNGVNTIEFTLTGGSGAGTFSDIVLWWKYDV